EGLGVGLGLGRRLGARLRVGVRLDNRSQTILQLLLILLDNSSIKAACSSRARLFSSPAHPAASAGRWQRSLPGGGPASESSHAGRNGCASCASRSRRMGALGNMHSRTPPTAMPFTSLFGR